MTDIKKIKINNKNLLFYKEKFGWKGSGEFNDPIIIESVDDMPEIIKFKKINQHFIIRNVRITELFIVKCKNIRVEKCVICYLNLYRSRKIELHKNLIGHINIIYSKENVFQSNYLRQVSLEKMLSHKPNEGLIIGFLLPIILLPILWSVLILMIIIDYKFLLELSFYTWSTVVLIAFMIIIFMWLFIDSIKVWKFLRKLEPHQIQDNIKIPSAFFIENICGNCLYPKMCPVFMNFESEIQSISLNSQKIISSGNEEQFNIHLEISPSLFVKSRYDVKFPRLEFISFIITTILIIISVIIISFCIYLVGGFDLFIICFIIGLFFFISIWFPEVNSLIKKKKFYKKVKSISNP